MMGTTSNAIVEHWHFVVGLARKMAAGGCDAEDLAQDVFERWLRAAPRLLPGTNPRAWMSVVLRNLVIDQSRRRRVSATSAGDCAWMPEREQEQAPWWLELDGGAVRAMLAALPAAQRTTFERFELEGQSYEQISRELEISKNTVGVHVFRARQKLRKLLSEQGPAEGPLGAPAARAA